MSWVAYAMNEVPDGRFDWMPTFAEVRARLASEDDLATAELDIEMKWAQQVAREAGWVGSLSDPRVFTVPNHDTLQFGLFWSSNKDKAGPAAIVVSPQRLSWLGEPTAVLV